MPYIKHELVTIEWSQEYNDHILRYANGLKKIIAKIPATRQDDLTGSPVFAAAAALEQGHQADRAALQQLDMINYPELWQPKKRAFASRIKPPAGFNAKELPSVFNVLQEKMKRLCKDNANNKETKARIENARREMVIYQEAMYRVFMELLKNELAQKLKDSLNGDQITQQLIQLIEQIKDLTHTQLPTQIQCRKVHKIIKDNGVVIQKALGDSATPYQKQLTTSLIDVSKNWVDSFHAKPQGMDQKTFEVFNKKVSISLMDIKISCITMMALLEIVYLVALVAFPPAALAFKFATLAFVPFLFGTNVFEVASNLRNGRAPDKAQIIRMMMLPIIMPTMICGGMLFGAIAKAMASKANIAAQGLHSVSLAIAQNWMQVVKYFKCVLIPLSIKLNHMRYNKKRIAKAAANPAKEQSLKRQAAEKHVKSKVAKVPTESLIKPESGPAYLVVKQELAENADKSYVTEYKSRAAMPKMRNIHSAFFKPKNKAQWDNLLNAENVYRSLAANTKFGVRKAQLELLEEVVNSYQDDGKSNSVTGHLSDLKAFINAENQLFNDLENIDHIIAVK